MLSRLCAVPWGGAALFLLFPPVLLDLVPPELYQSTQSGLVPVEGRENQNLPTAAACPSLQASLHHPPRLQCAQPSRPTSANTVASWEPPISSAFNFFFFSFHPRLSSCEISWRCCLLAWGHTDRGTGPEGAVRTFFDGMT